MGNISKILVTGGAGFIGSHLVDNLVNKYEVLIFDDLDPQVHKNGKIPEYLNKKTSIKKINLVDITSLKKEYKDIDAIFHLASSVGVGQSQYKIRKYVRNNILGTANLLDLVINEDINIKKIIIASSNTIYGEGQYKCEKCGVIEPPLRQEINLKNRSWEIKCPICSDILQPIPTNENKQINSTSIYALSKENQEKMAMILGKIYGIPIVVLRYFLVFGERQSMSNPYTGVCSIFSNRILNNLSPLIYEDGLQTRDFINIKDIIQANLLALTKKNADYEIFNVGTGNPISILNLSKEILSILKSDLDPIITNKYRIGDIRHCFADISKIKEKLGYNPKTSLREGIMDLINWVKSQPVEKINNSADLELEKKNLLR